jgi:hypothetical protein
MQAAACVLSLLALVQIAAGCGRTTRLPDPTSPDAATTETADALVAETAATPDAALADLAPARGACSPVPEKLAELSFGFTAVAVDGDDIYAYSDQLWRLPRLGVPTPLPEPKSRPQASHLYVSGDRLFWLSKIAGTISEPIGFLTRDRELREEPRLLVNLSGLGQLQMSKNHFYVTEASVDAALNDRRVAKLGRIDRTSLIHTPEFSGTEPVVSITVDENHVYWSTVDTFFRRAHDGSPRERILEFAERNYIVANDATHIYVDLMQGPPTLVRFPKTGGTVDRIPFTHVRDYVMAVNDNSLYMADSGGSVYRMSRTQNTTDSTFVRLGGLGGFDDDDYDQLLAFDDTSVYFQAGPPPTDPGRPTTASDEDPIWLVRMCK